ncbi:hypothetical protein [Austwickia sp. TVS 96-490-7B]|uniref:hypothetical protein n=1 Tax=Austwickia sp. TVS 96-490-7B TaxID=2830843 RepID=UPI001C563614|nr:hypothetical protein [Austwickia sp. TVS 96-490-7B]
MAALMTQIAGYPIFIWAYLAVLLMTGGQIQLSLTKEPDPEEFPEWVPALEWLVYGYLALCLWCIFSIPTPQWQLFCALFFTNSVVLTFWPTRGLPGWEWPRWRSGSS